MTKRSMDSGEATAQPARRVKATSAASEKTTLSITNIEDGEVVHQTCLALHGECPINECDTVEASFISASVTDNFGHAQPAQHWPLHAGRWKALVMLTPGLNKITVSLHRPHPAQSHPHTYPAGTFCAETTTLSLTITYTPLLQLPPLHLAILIAKDSPLLIDCPPAKLGPLSSAHADVTAAVAKLRMAAYMWQAATAADFHSKALGRRAFRLDEEWSDTNTAFRTSHVGPGTTPPGAAGAMVAKVHLIRSTRTVAELRDAQVAQQNPRGRDRDALHRYFEAAIVASGIPALSAAARPVVAGMILDSHYSAEQGLILGHAALGCHKRDGISLGVFGSHLAYSWPRFLEEVPACLVDGAVPGDTVGNDNGQCETMRGACFVGQGALLHEVGHAFGAAHTSGIMARGYARSWGMNFLEYQGYAGLRNEAKWDIRDVLLFKLLPHFALPGDTVPVSAEFRNAAVRVEAVEIGDAEGEKGEIIEVSCKAGLVEVSVQSGDDDPVVYLSDVNAASTTFRINTTLDGFQRIEPLKLTVLGGNGKERLIKDAWRVFKDRPTIRIPGSDIVLRKQSVESDKFERCEGEEDEDYMQWAMLLKARGKDGNLHRATAIDLRVGCTMDGAVVYYADGSHQNCGPARNKHNGQPHRFGGHASQRHDLPEGEKITKVVICKNDDGWGSLSGIRMTLSNGESWGYLNGREEYDDEDDNEDDRDRSDKDHQESENIIILEPGDDEEIVGFFGQSAIGSGFTYQFGILTAPKGVGLPEVVYDMSELKNI
ncbi:putative peptidase family-domain-containing protein [Aspergillus heterothallicus]